MCSVLNAIPVYIHICLPIHVIQLYQATEAGKRLYGYCGPIQNNGWSDRGAQVGLPFQLLDFVQDIYFGWKIGYIFEFTFEKSKGALHVLPAPFHVLQEIRAWRFELGACHWLHKVQHVQRTEKFRRKKPTLHRPGYVRAQPVPGERSSPFYTINLNKRQLILIFKGNRNSIFLVPFGLQPQLQMFQLLLTIPTTHHNFIITNTAFSN
mgnify:CR=1 FL=1